MFQILPILSNLKVLRTAISFIEIGEFGVFLDRVKVSIKVASNSGGSMIKVSRSQQDCMRIRELGELMDLILGILL